MRGRVIAIATALSVASAACASSPEEPASTPATPTPTAAETSPTTPPEGLAIEEFDVPAGSRPHDVAPAPDGGVWYTAQGSGQLGWLDPSDGTIREIPLGLGSRPHGVIVGPDGAPWVTDSGRNEIIRIDPETEEAMTFPVDRPDVNLNTATFANGILWFTGQNGVYGRLDPDSGDLETFEAPPGPYGITNTPDGEVYYASLAGSHIARVDTISGVSTRVDPPTADQGARRVWSDSVGRIWVSEWNAGQVAVFDGGWQEWRLPGEDPAAYAVFVDSRDDVWLSDFGANAIVRFDPDTETFTSVPLPSDPGDVRQLHGRPGEVWGAESAADALVLIRTG